MARAKALADLGDTDLVEQLTDSKEELFNLRFQLATGQLDNTVRMRDVKRDIARVLTELRIREITDAEALAEREEASEEAREEPKEEAREDDADD